MQRDDCATPDELKLYAARDDFSLFELACIARRAAPQRVVDNTWQELRAHRRGLGISQPLLPNDYLAEVQARPAVILGELIGGALQRLMTAKAAGINQRVSRTEARELLALLDLSLPPEIDLPAAPSESPAERQARRCDRFRELGGKMVAAGKGWHNHGRRGALADLVREEQAAQRPRSDRKDVRGDLIAAMGVHRGS